MGSILLVSASFGGGHDVAALRLAGRLESLGFHTRVVDLLDLLPPGFGPALRHTYRAQLAVAPRSWTWICGLQARPSAGGLAARVSALATQRLQELLRPDTVAAVSTYPLASQLLGQLRMNGTLNAPAITVLTDMSVHPLWIAAGVDAHIALHTVAAHAARGIGARNVMVGGPLVPASFRPAAPGEQRDARAAFGLPQDTPLALVVAGSWGVGQVTRTAADVARTGLLTSVVACGRNRSARMRLAATGVGHALGWIDDMPTLFRACDVVVQSGGGLSTQEARASGLPVLTYRCLPGHGRANAAALDEAGWAPWVRTRAGLPAALAEALARTSAPARTDPAALIASIASGRDRHDRPNLTKPDRTLVPL